MCIASHLTRPDHLFRPPPLPKVTIPVCSAKPALQIRR